MFACLRPLLPLLMLTLAVVAGPADAPAQESSQPATERPTPAQLQASLQELLRETEQAQKELESGLISNDRLNHWRTRLPEIRARAATIETGARQDLESAQRLLDALGPAPEDGRETRPVATERDRLQTQVNEHQARLKQAQLVAARANELLALAQAQARERFTSRLLVQGPSAIYPSTWIDAGAQFTRAWSQLFSAVAAAETPAFDQDDWQRVAAGGVALVLAGLIAALLLRRLLLNRFPREEHAATPSTLARLSGALLHTLFYLLVPSLVFSALYAYLQAVGMMVGVLDQLVRNAMLAVSFGVLIDGLSRSVLASRAPSWRVLPVNDACAHRMERVGTVAGAVFSIDILLVRMGEALEAGRAIAVMHNLVFGILVSAILLWLVQREIWHPSDLTEAVPEQETRRRKARTWAGLGAIAFAVAVIGAALLGYYELSRFILGRTIVTGLLVGILLLVHAVTHEGVAAIFRATRLRAHSRGEDQTGSILQFWIGAAVDLILLLLGVLLALPVWGVEWTDLWALLRGAMLGFQVGEITISPMEIALAILFFAAILSLTRVLQRTLDTRVFPQTKFDIGVRDSLRTFTGYVGLVIGVLVALSTAGLNLSNLAIVAGALSVGIGFGLQAIVNNFVSGLILLFERPMKVGDWVVIGQHQGFIKRVRVRSTEIETFDQSSVIVPNSDFISQPIINWTHTNRVCRVIVPVHVAYGTDTQQVRDILLQAAREHPYVLRMPEAHVLFMSFGESAMHFELRVFSRDTDYFLALGSELRFAIDQKFREAGIVIPFPQRDLHIRSGSWQQGRGRDDPPTDIPDPGTTPPSGGPDSD